MRTIFIPIMLLLICDTISAMNETKRRKVTDDIDTITIHIGPLTLELAAQDGRLPSEWYTNSDMTEELVKSIMAAYDATPEGRVRAGKDLSNISATCKKNHAVLSDSKLCEKLLAWDHTRSVDTFSPELACYYYTVPGMRTFIKNVIIEAEKSRNNLSESYIHALKISSARQRIQEGIIRLSNQMYEQYENAFHPPDGKSGEPLAKIIQGIKEIDGNLQLFIPLQKAYARLKEAQTTLGQDIEDPKVKQVWQNDWVQVAPGMYRLISEESIPTGIPALGFGPCKNLRSLTVPTQKCKDDTVNFALNYDGLAPFFQLNTGDNDFIGNGIAFRYNTTDYMLMPACKHGAQRVIHLVDLTNMVTKKIVSENFSLTGSFKLIGDRLMCSGVSKNDNGTCSSLLLDWDLSKDQYNLPALPESNPYSCSVLAISERQTLLMGNVASGVRMEYDPKTKQCKKVITNLRLVHDHEPRTDEPIQMSQE